MNVTKYADLSQALEKSEKQLYEKISEECAVNFEVAIHDSIQKIKTNADSMAEIVDKVQSCKESYGEAAELVGKLSYMLSDIDKKVIGINEELEKLSEKASDSTSDLSAKVSALSEFSALLLQNSTEVTGLIDSQQKWKISCEEAFNEVMKSVELLIVDLNENKESICSETELMREYQKAIQFCVDDVKKSTDEYVKLVQEANVSLLFESFATFKNDFLTASNEQIRLISEIKDEQLKQKKMYLLGLIPAFVIIVLQIINILG